MNAKYLLVASLVMGLCRLTLAHEGHHALPTKGVQVNSARGTLVLSAQARSLLGLNTEEVVVGEVESTLTVYAETESPWHSRAFGSASVSGKIVKLLVQPGDVVVRDQVVAELRSRELESLRLEYLQAKKELAINRKLLELSRPAADVGAVPMQRTLELENAVLQSQIGLQIASIRMKTLGIDANLLDENESNELLHEIRSPIAGKVVHSDLAEGKFVEAFEHLYEIVNNDSIWVRLQLLEKDIYKVAIGQKVELSLPSIGIEVLSTIDRIDMAMEPDSKTNWAWITVSHPKIIPGVVGSARIRMSNQSERLTVPVESIFSDGLQSYVLVESAYTKAAAEYRKRNVVVSKAKLVAPQMKMTYVELVSGDIFPGDRVVTTGGHELSSLFFRGVLKLSESDRRRLGILTTRAEHRLVAQTLDLAAAVALPPDSRSVVSTELPGTIRSHQLSPGKPIHKGEMLVELVSPEFHSMQLDLLRTWLDASFTRQRVRRLQEVRSDVFSRRLLLESTLKAEQLEQRVESLKRQLIMLGLLPSEVDSIIAQQDILGYLPVRASMDGHLVSWSGTLGESVAANQSLVEIQNLQTVLIEAQVPTQNVQHIDLNARGLATLLANPQIQFPVTVARIGPLANRASRVQQVWLSAEPVSSQVALRDRMQLSIKLQTNAGSRVLAVPESAVLQDGIRKFAFIQKEGGYIERRSVVTGLSDGQWIEIAKGIKESEEVVIAGGRELQTAYASLR